MIHKRKKWKQILPFALAAACLFAVSVPAMADDAIDLDKSGSISIGIRAYATDEAVGGGSLNLYRIADIGDDNGYFYYTYTEPFSGCGEDLLTEDELAKAETAEAFSAWVSNHSVTAEETVTVSSSGEAYFADLSCGLYLVMQNEAAEGYNAINAFLVSVPLNEDGTWIYDVDATPKTSPVTKADEPKKDEPKDEPKSEPDNGNPDNQNPGGTGGTNGGNTGGTGTTGGSGTSSGSGTSNSGNAKTGDYNYYVYGAMVIGAVLVIVVVLRRRAKRAAQ